jgi:hypothetical protein
MTLEEMYGNAKALVEDRAYNIGEISEKTGLQKTANGWVKPKSNKGSGSPTQEGKKEIELRKAAMNGGTKERKALFKFEAENADDEQLKHVLASKNQPADRIEMYQAELEKRNKQNNGSKLSPEKKQKWENDAKNSTIATLKNKVKAMEDSKGINPHAEEIIEIYNKEINERDPNSEKVYNDKSMKPIQKDSACRITADTKIRLNQIKKKV